ncbi:hypothetical protein Nepgr_009476 [Nepenthes gracilis]|uniref:Zinc finger CCCH domain-containing protein 53-like n=1 Tax=Nepenthes gracilis TaxID=150966 RepID=A0AAD3XKF1_NEPGR|nr:hypothetical protein Nepgr_009476 [Nepenthes gracilis]
MLSMMMDSSEATRALFSRIQSIDPENASKIMGCILIQGQGEKEMLRLAFGPESLILAVINKAKTDLGIISSSSYAPTPIKSSPSPFTTFSNPISRPSPLSLSVTSPRLVNNGFTPYSPSSPSILPISGTNNHPLSTNHSLSYAAVVNGSNCATNGSFSSSISSPQLAFSGSSRENLVEDCPLQEQNLSFQNDPLAVQSKNLDFFDHSLDLAMSPSCRSDSLLYPYWDSSNSAENSARIHRRSCSFNDACFGTDDSTSGFSYKPCLYFARGFCKNGSSCKFVHGGGFANSGDGSAAMVGSPCKFDAFEQYQQEIARSKVAQQQRLAAQYMDGVNFPYNKSNFLQSEAQRSAVPALMMGEEFYKFNRCRIGRNDFSGIGGGDTNPSRQIYLTFPADSTFREEDVSNYFRMYGPVQDVRIPYQQKRMFGFVTFVYPETVKLILAKGNPHFVCDSRVLVKPYKEKGKLLDKKQQQQLDSGDLQQQQLERAEYFSYSIPTGLGCRKPFDLQSGARMLCNAQEISWRKKLEQQADLQQALELQGRRLMTLPLMDLKNCHQHLHEISAGCSIYPPNHSISHPSNGLSQDTSKEDKGNPTAAPVGQLPEEVNVASIESNGSSDDDPNPKECNLPESLENILPDNLFSSPTKSAGEPQSIFSPVPSQVDGSNISASANFNSLRTSNDKSGFD